MRVYVGQSWHAFGASGGDGACVACGAIMDNYAVDDDDVHVYDEMMCEGLEFLCLPCAGDAGIKATQGDRVEIDLKVALHENQDR